uniref:Uncharacterized protein n=1 Tax=Arundo donax TaxID=35708 RepID=A0A0A9A4V7_ARUDO
MSRLSVTYMRHCLRHNWGWIPSTFLARCLEWAIHATQIPKNLLFRKEHRDLSG